MSLFLPSKQYRYVIIVRPLDYNRYVIKYELPTECGCFHRGGGCLEGRALFPDFLELWADSALCSAVAADGCLEGQSAFLELWAGLLQA